MELISCNIGIIKQTVVLQEHALEIFQSGRHLPLHLQPVKPTCRIACHQCNNILTDLEDWLLSSSHILNADHFVISLKGREPQTGLLSLARKKLGLCQLGRNRNSSNSCHVHTHINLHTESHKYDIE